MIRKAVIRKAIIVVLTLSATVVAGVSTWSYRSVWAAIVFEVWSDVRSHVTVFVHDGVVHLRVIRPAASPTSVWRIHRLGFTWYSQNEGYLYPRTSLPAFQLRRPNARCRHYFAPCWLLTLLLVAYPTIALVRGQLRRRLRGKGLCLKCGYNLRGLTVPRCPECFTEFDPSTVPSLPG